MADLFGEENFVASVIWEKKFSPQNDDNYLTEAHDYLITFCRNLDIWRPTLLPRTEDPIASFSNPDKDPRGPWTSGALTSKTKAEGHSYPIAGPNGAVHYPPLGPAFGKIFVHPGQPNWRTVSPPTLLPHG